MDCSPSDGRPLDYPRNPARPSARSKADAEGAPVAAPDKDGGGQVFDQHEIAAAHVTAIGLEQKALRVVGNLLHGAVVVDAPVAAVGGIPDGIVTLRLTVVGIVRGQVPALGPGDTKDDPRVGVLQRI